MWSLKRTMTILTFICALGGPPALLVHAKTNQLPIASHSDRVRSLIESEVKKGTKQVNQERKAARIIKAINKSALKYEIDPLILIAIIHQESSFRTNAKGRHGEIGLMQLKPRTARWIARKNGIRPPSRRHLFRPEVNIELGAAYLKYLYDLRGPVRFIQAYNSGPHGMHRTKAEYGAKIARRHHSLQQALAVTDVHSLASLESDVERELKSNKSNPFIPTNTSGAREGSRVP